MFMNYYIAFAIPRLAVCVFVWAWVNFRKGLETWGWIKVRGEVLSSDVVQSGMMLDSDLPTYQIHATVKYEVDGNTY